MPDSLFDFDTDAPERGMGGWEGVTERDLIGSDADSVPTVTYERGAFFDDLFDLFNEAQEDNWDGYGAQVAHPAALEHACRMVHRLPVEVPSPEPEISPTGSVYLTWRGSGRRLVLDVKSDGRIVYAALLGVEKPRGTAYGTHGLPTGLLDLLFRVLG